jgi:hypothetical protein
MAFVHVYADSSEGDSSRYRSEQILDRQTSNKQTDN